MDKRDWDDLAEAARDTLWPALTRALFFIEWLSRRAWVWLEFCLKRIKHFTQRPYLLAYRIYLRRRERDLLARLGGHYYSLWVETPNVKWTAKMPDMPDKLGANPEMLISFFVANLY